MGGLSLGGRLLLALVLVMALAPRAARAYQPTAQEIAELIVDHWAAGWTMGTVATFTGVSVSTVLRIVNRHRAGEQLTAPRGLGSRGTYRHRQWNEPRQEWLQDSFSMDPDMGAAIIKIYTLFLQQRLHHP